MSVSLYLRSKGYLPTKISRCKEGEKLEYYSPFSPGEKSPSFFVTADYKYYCFSSGHGGNVYELCKRLENKDYKEAKRTIDCISFKDSEIRDFENLKQKIKKVHHKTTSAIASKHIFKESRSLVKSHKNYLRERGINASIAENYLESIYYLRNGNKTPSGKYFFDIGWKTSKKDSYEIASGNDRFRFKSCIGEKAINYYPATIKKEMRVDEVAVFESMFDYLSSFELPDLSDCLRYYDIIILNTNSLVKQYIGRLTSYYKHFHLFVDNDRSGNEVVALFQEYADQEPIHVYDRRAATFPGHKDLNEYIVELKKHEGRLNVSFDYTYSRKDPRALFKAYIVYNESTSEHLPEDRPIVNNYSMDTEKERQMGKSLSYNETGEYLLAYYPGFKRLFDEVMHKKMKGKIKSVSFYFNQLKIGDNTILWMDD